MSSRWRPCGAGRAAGASVGVALAAASVRGGDGSSVCCTSAALALRPSRTVIRAGASANTSRPLPTSGRPIVPTAPTPRPGRRRSVASTTPRSGARSPHARSSTSASSATRSTRSTGTIDGPVPPPLRSPSRPRKGFGRGSEPLRHHLAEEKSHKKEKKHKKDKADKVEKKEAEAAAEAAGVAFFYKSKFQIWKFPKIRIPEISN